MFKSFIFGAGLTSFILAVTREFYPEWYGKYVSDMYGVPVIIAVGFLGVIVQFLLSDTGGYDSPEPLPKDFKGDGLD